MSQGHWWNCYICKRTFYTEDEVEAHEEAFEHKCVRV